jgi:hypothetical protein
MHWNVRVHERAPNIYMHTPTQEHMHADTAISYLLVPCRCRHGRQFEIRQQNRSVEPLQRCFLLLRKKTWPLINNVCMHTCMHMYIRTWIYAYIHTNTCIRIMSSESIPVDKPTAICKINETRETAFNGFAYQFATGTPSEKSLVFCKSH